MNTMHEHEEGKYHIMAAVRAPASLARLGKQGTFGTDAPYKNSGVVAYLNRIFSS